MSERMSRHFRRLGWLSRGRASDIATGRAEGKVAATPGSGALGPASPTEHMTGPGELLVAAQNGWGVTIRFGLLRLVDRWWSLGATSGAVGVVATYLSTRGR